jgi:hypothetical protein
MSTPPTSILYVGNSYLSFNNGIGWHVSRLHASTRPVRRLRSTSAIITGGGLAWHDVESYFRPNAVGSYSFDEANDIVFHDEGTRYELVLMMDCSQCPIHPRLAAGFREAVARHSATVRRHGARPALLMTWAVADRPEMTAELADAYISAGNANDALVVPVGLAFAAARAERPDIVLHMDDKSHPSLAGTYLAACTVYAALFGRGAEKFDSTSGLDGPTAHVLHSIAVDTVARHCEARPNGAAAD